MNLPTNRQAGGPIEAADINDIAAAVNAKAEAASLATKADLEGGIVPLSQLPEGLGEYTFLDDLQANEAPTKGTGWYLRFLDTVAEPEVLYQGAAASSGDINGNVGVALVDAVQPGDIIFVSVHGGGNTTTLGANGSPVGSWVLGTQGNTSGSTPHMCVRQAFGVVTTAAPAGTVINGSRSSSGGLVTIVAVLRGYSATAFAAQTPVNDPGGTVDPVVFASLAAPAQSVVMRSVTTQDNVNIGTNGVTGGLTLAGTAVVSGGTSARRGILAYQQVENAANVTGSVDLTAGSRIIAMGSALT